MQMLTQITFFNSKLKPDVVAHACNPSTGELETGSEVQGHSKVEASLGYKKPCLKAPPPEKKKLN